MNHKLSLLLILTVSCGSHAENPTKIEMAEHLVDTLDYSQQFQVHKKECHENTRLLSAEDLANENPEYFGGITPSSKYWPLVQHIYEEFNRTACDFLDESDFLNLLASEYASKLSLEELQQALTFYNTQVGEKLIKANLAVSAELQKLISSRYADKAKKAQTEFAKRLAAIKKLHDKDGDRSRNRRLGKECDKEHDAFRPIRHTGS